MNVNGVGGSASLPVPLSAPVPASSIAGGGGAPPSGAAPDRADDVHRRGADGPAESRPGDTHRETTKPEPLPPLKGLTLGDIRAIFGIGTLASNAAADQHHASEPVLQSALSKYA
jgi:hypothetical protein